MLAGLLGRDTTSGSLRCHLVDRRMAGDEPHGRRREWWPSQPGGWAAGGGGVVIGWDRPGWGGDLDLVLAPESGESAGGPQGTGSVGPELS